MALRWKLNPAPTGLRRVGAGPRGSGLFDGTDEVASVGALGGDWKGPLTGWYWVCKGENTCHTPCATVDEAKKQATDHYKAWLKTAPKKAAAPGM